MRRSLGVFPFELAREAAAIPGRLEPLCLLSRRTRYTGGSTLPALRHSVDCVMRMRFLARQMPTPLGEFLALSGASELSGMYKHCDFARGWGFCYRTT